MIDTTTTQPRAFREGKTLGSGGMADVRECFVHAPWGEVPFAIKRLKPDRMTTSNRTAFEREAWLGLTAIPPHRNLVVAQACGVDDDGPYIIMPRIDGASAHDLLAAIRASPDKWPLIWRIARDGAAAVHHLHDAGVLHRDVSARNILLDGRGAAVVCDLGLARLETGDHTELYRGTPCYAAPERLRHRPATRASDVYALGAVLWHLAAGEPPFGAGPPGDILDRMAGKPVMLPIDTPPALARMLGQMIAPAPAQRPNIEQVCEHIAGVGRPLADPAVRQFVAFRRKHAPEGANGAAGAPDSDPDLTAQLGRLPAPAVEGLYRLVGALGDFVARAGADDRSDSDSDAAVDAAVDAFYRAIQAPEPAASAAAEPSRASEDGPPDGADASEPQPTVAAMMRALVLRQLALAEASAPDEPVAAPAEPPADGVDVVAESADAGVEAPAESADDAAAVADVAAEPGAAAAGDAAAEPDVAVEATATRAAADPPVTAPAPAARWSRWWLSGLALALFLVPLGMCVINVDSRRYVDSVEPDVEPAPPGPVTPPTPPPIAPDEPEPPAPVITDEPEPPEPVVTDETAKPSPDREAKPSKAKKQKKRKPKRPSRVTHRVRWLD